MILISPTAFKGTMSPWAAARLMRQSLLKKFPKIKTKILPLADGGDGTLEVLLNPLGGVLKRATVCGPRGEPVRARWGWIKKSRTAVIEMAEASGLKWVAGKNKILTATSYGTGELIRAALNEGCRSILIGVGGTATGDGGAGALEALGLRYFGKKNRSLLSSPSALCDLQRVEWKGLDKRLARVSIFVLCDVKNPLLGKNGSARIFGPQKGATPTEVKVLEEMLSRWVTFSKWPVQKNVPGAGAAGAMAFGLAGFLGARLVEGCSYIIQATGWEKEVKKASLILTGEGRLDRTSFGGKVIGEICTRRKNKPVAVICGETSLAPKFLKKKGIVLVQQMGKRGLKNPEKSLKEAVRVGLSGEKTPGME